MKKAELNLNEMPLPNRKIFNLVAERTAGNVSAFADMIGIKQQSLDRLFKIDTRSGKYPGVSSDIKKALKEKLGIDEIYLPISDDNSQADTMSGNNTSGQQADNVPSISYTHGRPYFNVDFLGGFDLIINDQTVLPEYNIDFKPYNKEGVMWCNITGHSMEPLISNGDIIALKEMQDWRDFILFGEVYGIVTEEMRTVKVVKGSSKGDDFLQLIPVNKSEEYQPQDIPIKLITHIFKVIGCMKKMW